MLALTAWAGHLEALGDEGHTRYFVVECGYKYNMMDIQAAIGLHQLNHVEANWLHRDRSVREPGRICRSTLAITGAAEKDTRTPAMSIDRRLTNQDRDQPRCLPRCHDGGEHRRRRTLPEHPGTPPLPTDLSAGGLEDLSACDAYRATDGELPLSAKLTDDDVAEWPGSQEITWAIT